MASNPLELKVPPLLLAVLTGGLMFALAPVLPAVDLGALPQYAFAGSSALLGIAFCVAGILAFRKHNTTVDPRYPDKTSSLVDQGIYRLTRNPMYVGFAFFLLAVTIFLQSPVLLALILLFILYLNRFQIGPEETTLEGLFGEAYRTYKARVPRWL